MNSSLKSAATVLALSLITSLSCFAQGHGVSGPDTKGSRTNGDEMVLTRLALQDILGSCMREEQLDLVRIISKTVRMQYRDYSKAMVTTQSGSAVSGENLQVDSEFNTPEYTGPNAKHWRVTTNIRDFTNSYPGAMYFNDVDFSTTLTVSLQTSPQLHYDETALPEAFDEYGNVIQDKIIITGTHWLGNDSTPIQLLNALTQAPVIGVFFNQARYRQCVDLKLGKYVPQAL